MKAKRILSLLFLIGIGAVGGWMAARHFSSKPETRVAVHRKIRFYQCSMDPQVKSDKPGKCPICGMELSPIYEGQSALDDHQTMLDSNSISVIDVQTEIVKQTPLERTLRVAGMIDDDETRHRIISAYNEGRIDKLFVNFVGAEVNEGQPLAAFYSPNLLSAEREYLVLVQYAATNGSANFQTEQKRMLLASIERLKRLGLTDAQITALEKTNATLLQTQILSPMSGTVVSRSAYEGQYVKEGEKLFEIGDFSTMWFRFDVYENDLPFLKLGQKIEVKTPSEPNKTYEAKISFIDPNINDATRSAKVRAEIRNPMVGADGKKHRELLHRLYAEGVVKLSFPETLVVSRNAVLNPGGEPIVYVARENGSYEARNIKVGLLGDAGWQVLAGLSEGERIVTSGNLLIDAQAQFDRGIQSAANPHNFSTSQDDNSKAKLLLPLSEEERRIADEFLIVADKISQALSRDDLKNFNEQSAKLPLILSNLSKVFSNDSARENLVENLERTGHLPMADDLAMARKLFIPFSAAAVEFAKTLQRESQFKTIKIYKCPMADQAVPDAPKNAFWMQTNGPLRNPFFGPAMLTCGSEVTP